MVIQEGRQRLAIFIFIAQRRQPSEWRFWPTKKLARSRYCVNWPVTVFVHNKLTRSG
jgi:hypothetical protein